MTLTLVRNARRKIPLTSRPDGSVLNPDHPLVRSGSLAWANFGQGFGSYTMRDQSGRQNNGTLTGYSSGPTWSRALGRACLSFNGTSTYIQAHSPFISSGNRCTYSIWFNASSLVNVTIYNIFGVQNDSYTSLRLRPGVATSITDDSYTTYTFGNGSYLTQWNHVAFTQNAGVWNIWLNGVQLTPANQSATLTLSRIIRISGVSGLFMYLGALCDPLVTTSCISPSIIARLANPGNVMLDTGGCSLLLPPRRVVFPSAGTGGGTVYTLTAGTGSYTSSGTAAAAIIAIRNLSAGTGSYTSSGTAAAAKVVRNLTAGTGSYSSSGTAAAVKAVRNLAGATGTLSVTGTAATVKVVRELTGATGTYSYTGTAATIFKGKGLAAGTGTYATTGTAATVKVVRKITGATGTLSITGTPANLGLGFIAGVGTFTVTGTSSTLKAVRAIAASTGTMSLTGISATLTYTPVGGSSSGAVLYYYQQFIIGA